MNKYTKEEIEQILELDKKRTQGSWRTDLPDEAQYIFLDEPNSCKTIAQVRGWGWLQKLGGDKAVEIQDANCKFIASAPDMANIIRQLQAMIEEQKNHYLQKLDKECLDIEARDELLRKCFYEINYCISKREGANLDELLRDIETILL